MKNYNDIPTILPIILLYRQWYIHYRLLFYIFIIKLIVLLIYFVL